MDTYSELSPSTLVLERIDILITNRVLENIQREPRTILGRSPMSYTKRGEIAISKYKEVLSPVRLGTSES